MLSAALRLGLHFRRIHIQKRRKRGLKSQLMNRGAQARRCAWGLYLGIGAACKAMLPDNNRYEVLMLSAALPTVDTGCRDSSNVELNFAMDHVRFQAVTTEY
ncbi:hypothetical protein [Mesorhizobium sp. NFR06]|uniref:hypothetical protein n=1 Tax=Mesorhizobium sp. NFR06 TaxID=1566290 RepID=UPI00122D6D54|nr:hypothetical protein [Mesorhizobium sp. NFR06]